MKIELQTCPVCGTGYDPLRARAIVVRDGRVRAFCSPECKAREFAPPVATSSPEEERSARHPLRIAIAIAIVLVVGSALGFGGRFLEQRRARAVRLVAPIVKAAVVKPLPTTAQAIARLVPKVPKIEENDAWFHPLAGPIRRLPIRNTRRFGAAREGLRPEECGDGHCGVDLGSQKGEVVMAAHDGVVERVVREDTGKEGRFVRVNHHGGTVVTSYMHLDEIEPDLKPGIPVKAGQVLGTVGQTGVFHSGPHLHFAVSVRPAAGESELFIDPEPMLHLWPLKPSPLLHRRSRTAQVMATSAQGS